MGANLENTINSNNKKSDEEAFPKTTGQQSESRDTEESPRLEIVNVRTENETGSISQKLEITDVRTNNDDSEEGEKETDEESKGIVIETTLSKEADVLQCAKENVEKNLRETMDSEDLLQVTTVKEVNDDIEVLDNEKDENSSSASSEKDDNDEMMDAAIESDETCSKLAKEDNDGVDATDVEDDGELVDAVDIEENSLVLGDKFADDMELEVTASKTNISNDDAADIEESTPLNQKVEKEYKGLLNNKTEDKKKESDSSVNLEIDTDILKKVVVESKTQSVQVSKKVDVTTSEKPLGDEKRDCVDMDVDVASVATSVSKTNSSSIEDKVEDDLPTVRDEKKDDGE